MNPRHGFAGLVLMMLAGCSSTGSRLDAAAEMCARQVSFGVLVGAEASCTEALGLEAGYKLPPDIKSQRLFELARIKRQLAKFSEGESLVRESLAIERALPGERGAAIGERLVELSLDLAGLGRWEEGADLLESALSLAVAFDDTQRTAMANVLKNYARQFGRLGQDERSALFKREAEAQSQR